MTFVNEVIDRWLMGPRFLVTSYLERFKDLVSLSQADIFRRIRLQKDGTSELRIFQSSSFVWVLLSGRFGCISRPSYVVGKPSRNSFIVLADSAAHLKRATGSEGLLDIPDLFLRRVAFTFSWSFHGQCR